MELVETYRTIFGGKKGMGLYSIFMTKENDLQGLFVSLLTLVMFMLLAMENFCGNFQHSLKIHH